MLNSLNTLAKVIGLQIIANQSNYVVDVFASVLNLIFDYTHFWGEGVPYRVEYRAMVCSHRLSV